MEPVSVTADVEVVPLGSPKGWFSIKLSFPQVSNSDETADGFENGHWHLIFTLVRF